MMLRVNRNKIVDEQERAIKLLGCHIPFWSIRGHELDQKQYDHLKSIGFNCIDIGQWWQSSSYKTASEKSRTQAGSYNEQGMDTLKQNIQRARDAGLWVIVQVRITPNDSKQKSPWYTGWTKNDDMIFNNPDPSGITTRQRFVNYLDWLCDEVMGMDGVIGIEPWHFPYHQEGSQILYNNNKLSKYFNEVAPLIISTIRAKTNKLIFINAPVLGHYDWNHATAPQPFTGDNIVYATGGYGDHGVAHNPSHAPWTSPDPIPHPHPSYKAYSTLHNVPFMSMEGPGIMQGAWGSENRIPNDRFIMFEEVMSSLYQHMEGTIVHAYGAVDASEWMDEVRWGFLLNDNWDQTSEGRMVDIIKNYLPPEPIEPEPEPEPEPIMKTLTIDIDGKKYKWEVEEI